jgi:serine/threonine protein kinase
MRVDQGYNEKVDVWSFGMVLYELTTNIIPYHYCQNQAQIVTEVYVNKKTPPLPKNATHIHPTLLDLMKQCWNWDPQQRPSFTQIVQILREKVKEMSETISQNVNVSSQNNLNISKQEK